jgi:hypothetical protein
LGIEFGFMVLITAFIAVACSQFDKLKAAVLDIRQENITPQHGQEDGHVNATAICIEHAKLNACIRHH